MADEQHLDSRPDDLPAFCRSYPTLALFVVSIAGLFLELLLIRWIGTEVRIFACLQNTVLVVCFLGDWVGHGRQLSTAPAGGPVSPMSDCQGPGSAV